MDADRPENLGGRVMAGHVGSIKRKGKQHGHTEKKNNLDYTLDNRFGFSAFHRFLCSMVVR
jgi:hypothetical protein